MTYRFEITLELLALVLRSGSDLVEDDEEGMLGETDRRWDWARNKQSITFLIFLIIKFSGNNQLHII